MSSPRPTLLAMLASTAMIFAACGSADDDNLTSGEGSDEAAEEVVEETVPDNADDEPSDDDGFPPTDGDDMADDGAPLEPVVADDSGYLPTAAMNDITDPAPHTIDEVVVSEDGMTIGVRYQAASEPCSGAIAGVVEDDASITVSLVAGLHPDAASMSCIAQVMDYEQAVALQAPVGDREIIVADEGDNAAADGSTGADASEGADEEAGDENAGADAGDDADSGDDMNDGLSPPASFVGLSLDEASAKAESEGRAWRISRQDDEEFMLTADFDPDRVTFEVDAGVVTAAEAN